MQRQASAHAPNVCVQPWRKGARSGRKKRPQMRPSVQSVTVLIGHGAVAALHRNA